MTRLIVGIAALMLGGCASIPDSEVIAHGDSARVELMNGLVAGGMYGGLWVDVERPRSAPQLPPDQIKRDIRERKDFAEAAVPRGSRTTSALDASGAAFIACMVPKGYTAKQWDPRATK